MHNHGDIHGVITTDHSAVSQAFREITKILGRRKRGILRNLDDGECSYAGKATLNHDYSRIVAFLSRLLIDDIVMAVQLQNIPEPLDTEIKSSSRKPTSCKDNTLL